MKKGILNDSIKCFKSDGGNFFLRFVAGIEAVLVIAAIKALAVAIPVVASNAYKWRNHKIRYWVAGGVLTLTNHITDLDFYLLVVLRFVV